MRIGARSTQLIEIYPFTKSFFFTHIILMHPSIYIIPMAAVDMGKICQALTERTRDSFPQPLQRVQAMRSTVRLTCAPHALYPVELAVELGQE